MSRASSHALPRHAFKKPWSGGDSSARPKRCAFQSNSSFATCSRASRSFPGQVFRRSCAAWLSRSSRALLPNWCKPVRRSSSSAVAASSWRPRRLSTCRATRSMRYPHTLPRFKRTSRHFSRCSSQRAPARGKCRERSTCKTSSRCWLRDLSRRCWALARGHRRRCFCRPWRAWPTRKASSCMFRRLCGRCKGASTCRPSTTSCLPGPRRGSSSFVPNRGWGFFRP